MKANEEFKMPDAKETLLYILGSEEFFSFYNSYMISKAATVENAAKQTDLLESYLEKINTPECYVAVLGIQGSGKTSLLNSLIFGDEVLPVEVEETTCIPTLIRRIYPGEEIGAEVHYRDERVEPMPLKREFLEKIVDNRYNPGNLMEAAYVVCKVTAPLVREGFVFVDLPGVGSLTDANEEATLQFLQDTHIGIFLLRTVPPITDSEADFIRIAWPMVQQSLFVQNLWSQETQEEVREGMKHNEQVLQVIAKEKQTQVPQAIMPVDIAQACQGSFTKDAQLIEQSGLDELRQTLRSYANQSFLHLFYQQTAQFFYRLIRRAQERIDERMAILKEDQEQIVDKISAKRQKFIDNKENLQEQVSFHCEDFLEKISAIKMDWLPENLEKTTQSILNILDDTPIEDLQEEEFRQFVRQTCSDTFGIAYKELQSELARAAENYVESLSDTLREMASLDQVVQNNSLQNQDQAKDPNAAKGWSVILSGTLAPVLTFSGVLAGPAGWGIFGGAMLAGSLVRWISGATAHKRILRGMRKALGDVRRQIRKKMAEEIDNFAQAVVADLRSAVKNELIAYESELQKIEEDLRDAMTNKSDKIAQLEDDFKQANVFLATLKQIQD